jgi:hypothetical protein
LHRQEDVTAGVAGFAFQPLRKAIEKRRLLRIAFSVMNSGVPPVVICLVGWFCAKMSMPGMYWSAANHWSGLLMPGDAATVMPPVCPKLSPSETQFEFPG